MHVGCKYKLGDVIKGLEIISNPYKNSGKRDYRAIVRCVFCGKEYEIVLSEIHRHIFDGCGCQRNRSNSVNWQSFEDWCVQNNHNKLLNAWDYDLNDKTPNMVSSCTSDFYYFKCPCGKHRSSLWKILSLTRYGKTKTVCKYCNSFGQKAIDLYGENILDLFWDYDKNSIDPFNINYSSHKYVWFKCINNLEHGSYKTLPKVFLQGCRCPVCANEQCNSFLQEKVDSYLTSMNFHALHERQCSIIAINPKNGYQLPYDNDVEIIDGKHLIIEVNGKQHYDIDNGWNCKKADKDNTTPEQVLKDLQWRDEYKKQYALSQGYYYLAIPYTAEKNDEYKYLIDDKIKEIIKDNTKLLPSKEVS